MRVYAPIPRFEISFLAKTAAFSPKGLPSFLKWLLGTKGRGPLMRKATRWVGRQIHAVAGTVPGLGGLAKARQKEVLKELGAGLPGAESELVAAQKALAKARAKKGMSGEVPGLKKGVARARAGLKWNRLTGGGTMLGAGKAMLKHPFKTMGLGWKSMDPWSKGLFLGTGGLGAYEYMNPPEDEYGPEGLYENRGEHLGSEIGSNIGFLATGTMPFLPMVGASYLADKAFSVPGRLLGQG